MKPPQASPPIPPLSASADSGTAYPPPTPNSNGPERVPAEWGWHYRTLMHLRERLLRAHKDHADQAIAPAETRGVDFADTTQERLDRDVLWAELGAEDEKLFEVDCALQRLREGVYGLCEETGRPIPRERLRAVPWTRYCRAAAEKHERLPRWRTHA